MKAMCYGDLSFMNSFDRILLMEEKFTQRIQRAAFETPGPFSSRNLGVFDLFNGSAKVLSRMKCVRVVTRVSGKSNIYEVEPMGDICKGCHFYESGTSGCVRRHNF